MAIIMRAPEAGFPVTVGGAAWQGSAGQTDEINSYSYNPYQHVRLASSIILKPALS